MALRAVIFAAKSTADEKGSIPQQIAECEQHVAAQGWTLDRVESDEAASAWSGNRGPGLERAMKRCEQIAADDGSAAFVVWKSNRLARGELTNVAARHLIDYYRWADKAGVQLVSVTDPATFADEIVTFVVGQMNALDSKSKSDAVRRSRRAAREKGDWVYGDVYGYKPKEGGGIEPDPVTSLVVQRIFALVAQGTSQQEVTRILNRERVPTARNGAAGWVQGTISQILRSRAYVGQVPADNPEDRQDKKKPEKWKQGKHEALVDQGTWDAAQSANARRAKKSGKGGGRPSKAGHLLGGHMLHHAACGSAMTPRTYTRKSGVRGVYECVGRKNGVCGGLVVPMEQVDDAIVGYLAAVGLDTGQSLRLLDESRKARAAAADETLREAREGLTSLEEQKSRLWKERREGLFSAEDWATFSTEYTEEKAAHEAQISQLEAMAAAEAAAPATVPAVADALALIRDFIARGDRAAVRNAIASLFEDFLIGESGELEPQRPEAPTGASKRVRDRHPELADQSAIAQANAAAELEADDLPYPEPAPDPLVDGVGLGSLVLLPEPREEALKRAAQDETAFLVDEHGRSVFRRLPLASTDADALAT